MKLIFFVILSFADARAFAQVWTPPGVTADLLTKGENSRLPPDEVEVAGPSGFADRLQALQEKGGVQRQDIAMIRVEIRGQWFISAEVVAKEKAASLGANFIVLEASLGGEEYVGSSRVYRAVRLQRYDGLPVFTRSREAVEGARASRTPPPAPAFAPIKTRVPPMHDTEEELEWLWRNHHFVLSNRMGVDLSDIAEPAWRDLENTVRLRFPKAEHEKLMSCYQRGSKVVLDLKRKSLTPSC